jgi:hypothetical protein
VGWPHPPSSERERLPLIVFMTSGDASFLLSEIHLACPGMLAREKLDMVKGVLEPSGDAECLEFGGVGATMFGDFIGRMACFERVEMLMLMEIGSTSLRQ